MLGIKIVRQNCQGLVETLGKYSRSVEAGLHFYIPFIQRIQSVELAMHPLRLEKYSVITQDNAEIEASVTLNYHVTDAKNQALVETAQAEAEATKKRADAESYRIKKIQEALESVSDNYFKDQSIVAFTKLAQSDTNLVVMSKEEISDLGNIPVIEKMLEMKK